MNNFFKSNYHYLLLIVFAFTCYHFLWYEPYSMKWDLAEQYLPWRYFTGKALANETLPFWNPFQLGGYPSFADPQSSAWYYPSWFIGSTVGYSMKIIELEILSFILLGGLGLFAFSKKVGNSTNSSFIVSLCYIANGYFVGNAQHLTWIAAAAWIPWLFYQYLHIRKSQYNIHLIWFLIVLYLFVTSSYPAFLITCVYIIFIDQLILLYQSSTKSIFIRDKIVLALLSILAIFPVIYSTLISANFFSRGAGISLEKALQHPFSWQSLFSLIAPFSSFKNPELFKTDISMANAYVGLLPVMLLLVYLFSKKNKRSTFWLILSIIFLVIAFGEQTPIRALLYNYLPGFNLFRFPSLFRLFFIICILLFSASYYDSLKIYIEKYRYKIINILLVVVLVFGVIIVYNISAWKPFSIQSLNALAIQFETSTFYQHIIYQLAFQSILLLLFCILLYKRVAKFFLLILICADLFLSVRLNAMATMVLNTKSKDVDELIKNADKNFHVPKFQPLINSLDQQYEYRWPLNWNMNCYFNQIAIDGYNPFVLNTFNTLEASSIKDSVWQNPWLYSPSTIIYTDSVNIINPNTAWVKSDEKYVVNYTKKPLIDSLAFSANGIHFTYFADTSTCLILAQNPFPGWVATIDGLPVDIITTNYSQQLILLNKGSHHIEWLYDNKWLNIICYIHLFIFMFSVVFASMKTFQRFL
jgi:hypothetical protein